MSRSPQFSPDWQYPAPAASITSALAFKGISVRELSALSGVEYSVLESVLGGLREIDESLARALHEHLGGAETFWLERERQYRVRVRAKVEEPIGSYLSRVIPIRDIVSYGWVHPSRFGGDVVASIVDFFGVESKEQFQARYEGLSTSAVFRRSEKFAMSSGALASWMRYGEIAAASITSSKLDRERLAKVPEKLRQLTREKDPAIFFPKLQSTLAKVGVALVVAKPPSHCPVSGVAKILQGGTAMVLLSFRYKTDDHFWFTLFHELGHLILHKDMDIALESDDMVVSQREEEANNFSAETLIPVRFRSTLKDATSSKFSIVRAARKLGVSPGIVVGQMQHMGLLRRNQFNFLKHKFAW